MHIFGIAVIDKDALHFSRIVDFLSTYEDNHPVCFSIRYFVDIKEFDEYQRKVDFNIIILDVAKGSECFDFIDRMRKQEAGIQFIVSNGDYGLSEEAYRHRIGEYVIKPFNYESIEFALTRTIPIVLYTKELKRLTQPTILVKDNRKDIELPISKILFLEKSGNNTWFFTDSGKYKKQISLDPLKKDLDQGNFVQINQGCIVNWEHVTSFKNDHITIRNFSLTVSRNYLALVKFHMETHPLRAPKPKPDVNDQLTGYPEP